MNQINKTCTNCPGSTDHNTSECPMMREGFEAYAKSRGWDANHMNRAVDNPERYDDWGVQPEWLAFKAGCEWRAALSAPPAAGVQGEREAFEVDLIKRWKSAHPKAFDCSEEGQKCLFDMMLARSENGEYENLVPREAWQAWQARAALSAPSAAQDYFPRDLLVSSVMNADEVDPTKVAALSVPAAAGVRHAVTLCEQVMEKGLRGCTVGELVAAIRAHLTGGDALAAMLSAPPAADGMCNADNPASRCECREEFGHRVCAAPPAAGAPGDSYLESCAAAAKMFEQLAPTPPASEQQRAVVMPELHDLNHHERYRAGWNACVAEFLRLNPHLAKGEGV